MKVSFIIKCHKIIFNTNISLKQHLFGNCSEMNSKYVGERVISFLQDWNTKIIITRVVIQIYISVNSLQMSGLFTFSDTRILICHNIEFCSGRNVREIKDKYPPFSLDSLMLAKPCRIHCHSLYRMELENACEIVLCSTMWSRLELSLCPHYIPIQYCLCPDAKLGKL